jgi:hypothetical protein
MPVAVLIDEPAGAPLTGAAYYATPLPMNEHVNLRVTGQLFLQDTSALVVHTANPIVTEAVLASLRAAGVDPQAHLRDNDSYTALAQVDALLKIGRTQTNVNDIVVGLAYGGEGGSG